MSELDNTTENQAQEVQEKPKSPATKLYAFIFLIYFAAMLLLLTSC